MVAVKASPWTTDIPVYLFLGGLAGGSSLLAAGAARTGRPALRRTGRVGAMVAIAGSFAALIHDLGRPARFVNMLRVAKPTSPMSVGTWLLTAYGPAAVLAGSGELSGLLPEPWSATAVGRMLGKAAGPAGPARRMALAGVLVELVAQRRMESSMGVTSEPLHQGTAGRTLRAGKWLAAAGAAGAVLAGSRMAGGRAAPVSKMAGAALLAGSASWE